MPGKAPVDAVGGTQSGGPWPEGVTEIVEGDSYKRPVVLDDGSVQDLTVTITQVVRHGFRENPEEDGYSVSFTYTDPTLEQNGGTL